MPPLRPINKVPPSPSLPHSTLTTPHRTIPPSTATTSGQCATSLSNNRLTGHRFFDDTDILCQRWQSENSESVAELHVFTFSPHPPTYLSPRLIDFFRYFSRDFSYNTGVASIRAGLLKKDAKGWQNDVGAASTLTVQSSSVLPSFRRRVDGMIPQEREIDFA